MNWLFDFIGICRKHRTRTGWDGALQSYICSPCAGESNNYELWTAAADAANQAR